MARISQDYNSCTYSTLQANETALLVNLNGEIGANQMSCDVYGWVIQFAALA